MSEPGSEGGSGGGESMPRGARFVFGHDLKMLQEFMEVMAPAAYGVKELRAERITMPIISNNGYHVALAVHEDEQWSFDFTRYGDPL